MWDVVWTDPDRELRKDRIERKKGGRGTKHKTKDKYQSSRSSTSTGSSSTSSNKLLTTHSSLSKIRSNPQAPSSPTTSSISNASWTSHSFYAADRGSILTVESEIPSVELDSSHFSEGNCTETNDPAGVSDQPTSQPDLPEFSIPSIWDAALAEPIAIGSYHLTQILGPDSIITRITEIVISCRAADIDAAYADSKVVITANISEECPEIPDILDESEVWTPPNHWDYKAQQEMPTLVVNNTTTTVTDAADVSDDDATSVDEVQDDRRVAARSNRNWVTQLTELESSGRGYDYTSWP
ncbi:hypothetical protein BGZ63DRAFT_251321 [Mariannaea sp. PMI_226]|nr:hypothetical protein BGZ63DRAFT_251321 [Mariannaea sp. PMI_226]